MKWKNTTQLGRINYNLQLPRRIGELSETYADPTIVPFYPLDQMVQFSPEVNTHNDEFVLQECSDIPLRTVTTHYNGLYFATLAKIDIQDTTLGSGRLLNFNNINIQRQHGVPWSGATWNIDDGGMIDEYLIISRRPLTDTNLPANGVPKILPVDFGLNAGWQLGDMDDIILAERRRYQPDARFIATQPLTASTTYGDLGDPVEDPLESSTRRFVSFTLADVDTWGNTNIPTNGPTIYVYRYVRMYASERTIQRFGTTFNPSTAQNLEYLQMQLQVTFPAINITMEGTLDDANLGELAVAYSKDLLQRRSLTREVDRNPRN